MVIMKENFRTLLCQGCVQQWLQCSRTLRNNHSGNFVKLALQAYPGAPQTSKRESFAITSSQSFMFGGKSFFRLTHFSQIFHFYTPHNNGILGWNDLSLWFFDVFRGYRNVTLGLNLVNIILHKRVTDEQPTAPGTLIIDVAVYVFEWIILRHF